MNPYLNGKRKQIGSYHPLYDPTVDGEMDQHNQHTAQTPAATSRTAGNSGYHPLPEPEPYSNSYAPQATAAIEQHRSTSGSSVGAHRMPSSHEQLPLHRHQMPTVPSHTVVAEPPWDANAVTQDYYEPEAALICQHNSLKPPSRRQSFSNPVLRFWDSEAQKSEYGSGLGRAASIRNLFIRPGTESINEYADDEYVDQQIPISGDEYELNTWQMPSRSHSTRTRGSGMTRGSSLRGGNVYGEERDLGVRRNYTNASLAPCSEDAQGEERDEYAENLYGENNYDGEGYPEGYPEEGYEDGDGEYGDEEYSGEGEEDEDEKNGEQTSTRVVELYKGNLILDCPVSSKLLEQYPEHQAVREFTHMRYSAATCDPADFGNDEYTLRQMIYSQPRRTELFICVTIYNEDDILLARTLQGVFNNIRHLCHRDRSSTWGPDAWKKIVVCVVADGREKLNPRAKALMSALGVYQEGFAKNMVNNRAVEAHIYEYTTMVRINGVSESGGVKLTTEKATPVQLMFCMKEKNKKKINSHRWFFQAFGEILRPNVCVLLDAGTRPGNHAIYHLWKTFALDKSVAGACGEIAAMLGPGCYKLINPLVAAQNFEYKISNILDKPSESVFGFISVLPGAFSAYRYEALQNNPNGKGPLEKYFKGEKLEGKGGVFQANMYLAEDRILCWELVSKCNANWVLRYVMTAKAHTDVPEHLSELILQRRRWLNGSFFAQVYSLVHCFGVWRSGHSIGRKLALHIQFLYQLLTLTFSWFSLANFFLVFHILAQSVSDPSAYFAPGDILSIVLTWIYAACIMIVFILSFGNRPQGTKRVYDMIVVFFCLMMAYMVFCTVYITVKAVQYAICANGRFELKLLWTSSTFRDLIISLLSTFALYLISSILFLDPWHVITSMAQYTLLSPVYTNVLNVYAFCNTHDISWGTKGDTAQRLDLGVVKADEQGKMELELPTNSELVDKYYLEEIEVLSSQPEPEVSAPPSEAAQGQDYYALFRSSVVVLWLIMNLALIAVVLNIGGFQNLIGTSDNPGNSPSISSSSDSSNSNNNQGSTSTNTRRAASGSCEELSTGGNKVTKVYMAVIFWFVAFMAAYRFLLSVIYLIKYMFRRI